MGTPISKSPPIGGRSDTQHAPHRLEVERRIGYVQARLEAEAEEKDLHLELKTTSDENERDRLKVAFRGTRFWQKRKINVS